MGLFTATLSQIAILLGFIVMGYILAKRKIVPENSAVVLSKLENTIFIPALVMGTFLKNFTPQVLSEAWKLLLVSTIILVFAVLAAILVSRFATKDSYLRNICIYGLAFSNFGFMGNAVMSCLFPEIFFEYLIFTLPFWTLIYLWGVPRLLIADAGVKQTFRQSLKSFCNPMFAGMLIGMLLGLLRIPLPGWVTSLIDTAGNCMSPIAMLLTGIVVSGISLKKTFTNLWIYGICFIKLAVMPAVFLVAAQFVELPQTIYVCALCMLAMPLGLNIIVIPSSLGKDTSISAGLALVSHLLSAITIPLIFLTIR